MISLKSACCVKEQMREWLTKEILKLPSFWINEDQKNWFESQLPDMIFHKYFNFPYIDFHLLKWY